MNKLKRGATALWPLIDASAGKRGQLYKPIDQKLYRRIDPVIFIAKLAIFAALLLLFGYGILSDDSTVTVMISLILGIPPLLMAWEILTGTEGVAMTVRKLTLLTVVPLVVLSTALAAGAPVLKVLCQIGLGVVLAGGTELAHQALHRTGVGKAVWDHPIGAVLCGLTGISFRFYQWHHLWHHKYNGTEKDSESFDYLYSLLKSESRTTRILGFILHVSMVAHYVSMLHRMWLAITGRLAAVLLVRRPEMSESSARKIQCEYRIMAAVLIAGLGVSIALQTTLLLMVWLIPVLIGWGPAHALIEFGEHWQCDTPTGNVFVNTRSIRAGRFAQLLTNSNDAHLAHHYDMHVPMDKLEAFEEWLASSHSFKYVEESYLTFFGKVVRYLWTGKVDQCS
ncbi:MAG: fatty acid desaturase [Planctomycetes bacterium]|nr:fatty acid desaturase [Planctomycetota bacterium]